VPIRNSSEKHKPQVYTKRNGKRYFSAFFPLLFFSYSYHVAWRCKIAITAFFTDSRIPSALSPERQKTRHSRLYLMGKGI